MKETGLHLVYDGIEYHSLKSLVRSKSRAKYSSVSSRYRKGWPLPQALGLEPRSRPKNRAMKIFFRNVEYESVTHLCREYNIEVCCVSNYVKAHNVTHLEAINKLVDPVSGRYIRKREVEFRGVTYKNPKTLCWKFNVDPAVYRMRLRRGWTQEQALGLEPVN